MGKHNKQQMKAAVAAATATKNNQENENDVGKYCSFCYLLKKENNKHYLWLVNKNKNLKTVEKDMKNGFGHEEDENRVVILELSEPYEKKTRLFTQKEFLDEFNQCASVLPDFQTP